MTDNTPLDREDSTATDADPVSDPGSPDDGVPGPVEDGLDPSSDSGWDAAGGGSEDAPVEEGAGEGDTLRDLESLRDDFDELNDRHLRLAAEFNNYRRRQESERLESWGRAQAELVGRLLDVLDDLQRVAALDPADEAVTVESIVEGIDLVERKFIRTLEEAGAETVAPVEGDTFDPETMEAMMRVEDETGDRDDQVAQLFARGYVYKGHLVRAARVSVYKA